MGDLIEWWGQKRASGPRIADMAREVRRGYGVHFYSGRNGSGKSHRMVDDTIPDLDAGMMVLSTVRLHDYRDPRPCEDPECWCDKENPGRHLHAHPGYVRWTEWAQLLELGKRGRPAVVLADEITGVADSAETARMPNMVANELAQLRRADVVIRLTGLNYVRANKRIREATNAVTRCHSDFPVSAFYPDGSPRQHRQRRLTIAKTYDAETIPIDAPTEASFEAADLVVRSAHWIPGSVAASAYDTFDSVDRIGYVTDAGQCAYCGGTRTAPQCSCDDYVSRRSSGRTDRSARSAEDRPHRRSARRGDSALALVENESCVCHS
jgi:hypothetical protein